jgi:hypothetical protein
MSICLRRFSSWPSKEWRLRMSIFLKWNQPLIANSLKNSTRSYCCKATRLLKSNVTNWKRRFQRFLKPMTRKQEDHAVPCSMASQISLLTNWEVFKINVRVRQVSLTLKETSKKFRLSTRHVDANGDRVIKMLLLPQFRKNMFLNSRTSVLKEWIQFWTLRLMERKLLTRLLTKKIWAMSLNSVSGFGWNSWLDTLFNYWKGRVTHGTLFRGWRRTLITVIPRKEIGC